LDRRKPGRRPRGDPAFGLGQLVIATIWSTLVRLAVTALFAGPAAFAGYHFVLGSSRIGGTHGLWRPIFAGVGAAIITSAALGRLATPLAPGQPPSRVL